MIVTSKENVEVKPTKQLSLEELFPPAKKKQKRIPFDDGLSELSDLDITVKIKDEDRNDFRICEYCGKKIFPENGEYSCDNCYYWNI